MVKQQLKRKAEESAEPAKQSTQGFNNTEISSMYIFHKVYLGKVVGKQKQQQASPNKGGVNEKDMEGIMYLVVCLFLFLG